jgi:hypothetical protein
LTNTLQPCYNIDMTKEIRGYSGILIKTIQVPDMTVSEAGRVLAGHRKATNSGISLEDKARVRGITILVLLTVTLTVTCAIYGKYIA